MIKFIILLAFAAVISTVVAQRVNRRARAGCKANEVFSDCVNGGCIGARKCSEVGKPVICSDPRRGACKKGCRCKDEYLRDDATDKCIPQNQCPSPCKDLNEVFDNCTSACLKRTCDSLYETDDCVGIAACIPACRCRDGWVKNKNNVCIPSGDCPCTIGQSFKADDGCNTCYCSEGIRKKAGCNKIGCSLPKSFDYVYA